MRTIVQSLRALTESVWHRRIAGVGTGHWPVPHREARGSRGIRRYVAACAVLALLGTNVAFAQWPQWGGPQRDFVVAGSKVSETWPESGPTQLWKRELGGGYSAVLVEDGRLYTMYRENDQEVVAALDAESGKTLWEHRYDAPLHEKSVDQFGKGPNATPLLIRDRLVTVGVSARLHCLSKADGKVLWSHDLWNDYGGTVLMHGYSSSPLAYKDNVIVPVGGDGQALMAFRLTDGAKVWSSGDFKNSYASPKLIDVDGQTQIVIPMGAEVVGFDPESGRTLWSHPHQNQWDCNISAPQWCAGNILFVSSFGNCGSRALRLTRHGDKTDVEQLWENTQLKVGHTTTAAIGDYVYGSHWSGGPGFLTAINVKTGQIAWKKREVGKASLVRVGDRLLALDEGGRLALLRATPEAMETLSSAEVLQKTAWTVPTVVGSRIYLRDSQHIMALEIQ